MDHFPSLCLLSWHTHNFSHTHWHVFLFCTCITCNWLHYVKKKWNKEHSYNSKQSDTFVAHFVLLLPRVRLTTAVSHTHTHTHTHTHISTCWSHLFAELSWVGPHIQFDIQCSPSLYKYTCDQFWKDDHAFTKAIVVFPRRRRKMRKEEEEGEESSWNCLVKPKF